ncbi:MAG: VCBS repeat-containing protein [Chloroflexi bacterium]|nr:VCBS repeat-containing protein [Chloroflexota bacterium]
MKPLSPATKTRATGTKAFPFLFVTAWVCVGALVKWDTRWLYLLLGLTVIAALWAGRRQPALLRVLLLLALVFPTWKEVDRRRHQVAARADAPGIREKAAVAGDDAAVISALVTAEETNLKLSPKMSALSRGLLNLRLPGLGAEAVFAPSVSVSDVDPVPAMAAPAAGMIESQPWPVAKGAKEVAEVDLWRPLLDAVSWFDHAKVFIISGEHPNGDALRYEARGGFEALAKMKSGEWRSLHGQMKLSWQRAKATASEPATDWQITGWKTEEMQYNASPTRLFAEALDTAVRPPQDVAKLRRSQHYEATLKFYRGGMKSPPHPYFAPISANQKDGIAVADIDGDGFDDIYITVRIGTNMLLRNHGDGTFTEAATLHGLALPGHTTCALFADFDNDGDLDAMLGRSLLRTAYLENRGGKFFQYASPKHFPMAVISMSAADFNRDGLLDVYLCTYRPAAPSGASSAGGISQVEDGRFDWPDEFLSPELAREYRRRVAENRQRKGGTVLDQVGPPNVLLVNRGGGRFEVAPESSTVGLWRNSLQATWCDYNEDGWPDLYVPNDWGLNVLFRNDGPAGFTDVTSAMGLLFYGFSMGATWGDYDNDGRDDLYVSNMYSEPGRRMTTQIPGLDKMFLECAQGNYLYHRMANGKFKQVAGLEPPTMAVMKAEWSWGGHFTDFDNDSFLDLYVLSGYFTAPKEVSSELDLESNLWRTMVRTDENLSRPSFRFSPEWKRTPAPDNLGPEIDARLAGVERQGDKIWVHSLQGHQRNHYFANRGGRAFADISALSGLDNPADGRGFAVLDYDRDGWQDIALVNANQPLFNLYHNQMPAAGLSGGLVAIRFVGGNRSPTPSKEFACRDGYGARVAVDLGEAKLVREHRCGEGWSAQHSATMIVGIGSHAKAASVSVRWPSGKTMSTKDVPEGTLLTAYENPADAPEGELFTRRAYRVKPAAPPPASVTDRPMFSLAAADTRAKPGNRLRVYTTFATWCPSCKKHLPIQKLLKDELANEGVDLIAIPIDEADDNNKLAAYNREWHPPARLVNLAPATRKEATAAFAKALGEEPPLPSTVITDQSGHILAAQPGVPSISELRKWLELDLKD